MPTDDERRDVARRLRELPDDSTYPDLIGAIADHDGYYAEADAADRLADIIEPSEPKVKCVAEVKVDGERLEKLAHDAAVELTGIDRDALLALAEELDGLGLTGFSSGWSSGAVNVGSFARRIREALGVTDG